MTLFRISIHTEEGDLTVRLNDTCIIEHTGVCEIEIETGYEHIVQWFALGRKGSSYSITISNPSEAEFQYTRRLGNSGKDFGGLRFTI